MTIVAPSTPAVYTPMTRGRDVLDISQLYFDRVRAQGPVVARMREIQAHYYGDIVVPLPELDRAEKSAVANFVAQGIDQHGMRIASVVPNVTYAALKPGVKVSEDKARIRRAATLGWLEESEFDIKMHRRARWLIAYACSPVIIRPDKKRGIPVWHLRDPLNTFPAPTPDPDDMTPDDVIFAFDKSWRWIRTNYPMGAELLKRFPRCPDDTMFTCLEYVDDKETVLMVLGDRSENHGSNGYVPPGGWSGVSEAIELERAENRAGICPAVIPGRINLDRKQGQFDSMIGIMEQQSKLMALEVNAVTRGVYPDTYLISHPDKEAEILEEADGIQGQIGRVRDGDIKSMNENPGYQTFPTIDRLERAMRQNAGIPAEFGGEAASNVRTGKRGMDILSAVVDFPVQEGQKIFARSLKHEIQRGVATAKGYFGNAQKSFYVQWKGAKGPVDYVPSRDFENDNVVVGYAHPGTDANQLVVGLGQRLGTELISKQSAREMDPLVDDPELERDRIISEGLMAALLSSIQTQAADPMGPYQPEDIARLTELVVTNKKELPEAIMEVQRLAQKRQASMGPEGTPEGPVPPGSPEAMPGLAMPGTGAEVPETIPAPGPSQGNLSQILNQLRGVRQAAGIPSP